MDWKSAEGYADQRAAIDAEIDKREPEATRIPEVMTPLGHFTRLYERTEELLGISGYHAGAVLEVTGTTEKGVPVGVRLTVKNERTRGAHLDTRTLEAQWFDRGQDFGSREFASAKTSELMDENAGVLRDLDLLEESVTAATTLVRGDEDGRKVKVTRLDAK